MRDISFKVKKKKGELFESDLLAGQDREVPYSHGISLLSPLLSVVYINGALHCSIEKGSLLCFCSEREALCRQEG